VPGDIGELLERLGLGEHAAAFAHNKIDIAALGLLSDADLKELGVLALGDRRKLQAAISGLAGSDDAAEAEESPADRSASADPQRRQLTVMFCDMVGSTALFPATLQEALEARLDRSPQIREVAQVGAAIGREFPYDLLARVTSLPSGELDAALDDLVGSGLIFARGAAPDASYTFKHALVQDTAYDSMMRSKRRETHKRTAEALLERQTDASEAEPAVMARRYTEAGLLEDAIDWWTRAGHAAGARSANPEAVELIGRGLALIAGLPESEARDRRELALQTALFGPLISVRGQYSPEMEAAFDRTLEVC